jgi:hypothetical protein
MADKQQYLREAMLFGLLYRMVQGFRARTPFEKFKKYIEKGLTDPERQLPGDGTLQSLYERAIDANADRFWVRALKGIAKSPAWRQHIAWLDGSIARSDALALLLETSDRLLLPADAKRVKAAAVAVKRLRGRLIELQRFGRRSNEVAKWQNWTASMRLARDRMNRTLQKNRPNLNQIQRIEVIRLAIEATGLKVEETTDAIERQLRRGRVRKNTATTKG